jgi:hypothetical protein
MRKALAALTVLVLVSLPLQASAAVKAGATCTKAGITSTVNSIKYTCVKSGKKLVWDKGVKVVTPKHSVTPTPTPTVTATPTPTPMVTATPTPTPTPTKTFNSLWEKYDLTKPTSVDEVIKKSTDNFKSYTSVVRNSEQEIKFFAQTSVDETLITWVKDGSTYVARRFAYPKLPSTFSSIIAIDKTWLEATYLSAGFPANKAKGQAEGFCGGAPACGSADSNLWNYSAILKNNSMVNDKAGLAQTPAHEFFHAIQGILANGNGADAAGSRVPNWYWEGPAMFVGQETAGVLGFADYLTLGRPSMTNRYKNGNPINRTSNLSEIRANDGVIDPYAIGFAATEFLVSQVGIEKMLNVYAALGQGKSFDLAFKQGTGIELVDFYSMFEEIRGIVGFPKS